MNKKIILYITLLIIISLLGIVLGIYFAEELSDRNLFLNQEDSNEEIATDQLSSNSSSEESTTSSSKISLEDLKKKIDKKDDFILLDVRDEEEYNKKHISGSQSIPVDIIDSEYHKLSKDEEIIVYCSSGCSSCSTSSTKAYNKLKDLGFSNLMKLEEGFPEWQDAGYPVE